MMNQQKQQKLYSNNNKNLLIMTISILLLTSRSICMIPSSSSKSTVMAFRVILLQQRQKHSSLSLTNRMIHNQRMQHISSSFVPQQQKQHNHHTALSSLSMLSIISQSSLSYSNNNIQSSNVNWKYQNYQNQQKCKSIHTTSSTLFARSRLPTSIQSRKVPTSLSGTGSTSNNIDNIYISNKNRPIVNNYDSDDDDFLDNDDNDEYDDDDYDTYDDDDDDDDDERISMSSSTSTSKKATKAIKDKSTTTKSFSMPKGSSDDSQQVQSSNTVNTASSSSSSTTGSSSIGQQWLELGLRNDLAIQGLYEQMSLNSPTIVQQLVIPEILSLRTAKTTSTETTTTTKTKTNKHLTFLAATGSGKTLAYVVPILQALKNAEEEELKLQQQTHSSTVDSGKSTIMTNSNIRVKKRPKAIIIAPTRELCEQIGSVIKQLTHIIKLSSLTVYGGIGEYTQQKQRLEKNPIDIIVATPGRLLQHINDQNIILSTKYLQYIVIDEMDTIVEQGFHIDLQKIVYPVLYYANTTTTSTSTSTSKSDNKNKKPVIQQQQQLESYTELPTSPSIILTSATMTQVIQKMISSSIVDTSSPSDTSSNTIDVTINAKQHHRKEPSATTKSASANSNDDPRRLKEIANINKMKKKSETLLVLPSNNMKLITAPGLHKTVPRLQQVFIDVGNSDKITLLVDTVLQSLEKEERSIKTGTTISQSLIMIFCNTAQSCRAVEYALVESGIHVLSYHGELNSIQRSSNLQAFRNAAIVKNNNNNRNNVDNDDDDITENPRVLVCTDLAARGLDIPAIQHVIMFDFPYNSLDYIHRCGRTARGVVGSSSTSSGGSNNGKAKVTALITKRDVVLATAIERAVRNGLPLDGLSSSKSDYIPGGGGSNNNNNNNNNNSGGNNRRSSSSSSTTTVTSSRSKTSSGGGKNSNSRSTGSGSGDRVKSPSSSSSGGSRSDNNNNWRSTSSSSSSKKRTTTMKSSSGSRFSKKR